MEQEPTAPLLGRRVPPPLAVVDANVFARADWIRPIITAVQNGSLIAVWSPLIISEVNRLLTWLWIKRHGGDLSESARHRCSIDFKKWYAAVAVHFRVIDDRPPLARMWTQEPRDPWDQPIWTAAVRAKASLQAPLTLVVTDNLRDGPLANEAGLRHHDGALFVDPAMAIAITSAWKTFTVTDVWPSIDEARMEIEQVEGTSEPTGRTSVEIPEAFRAILESLSRSSESDANATDS